MGRRVDRPAGRAPVAARSGCREVVVAARPEAAPAVAEEVDVKGGDLRSIGDRVPPEREEGVRLEDADAVRSTCTGSTGSIRPGAGTR
jgi:hypothetical protein